MTKQFLYLTNDKLIALVCKGGAIVERDSFGPTDADSAAFTQYLARHASIPTHLVTDLIEEDFRMDTVPHVRGSDQEAVLNRKLAQLYRASTFRHAIVQGREAEGRRDDRVLFHAVTNAELLAPWLAALTRAEVPLEGIQSSAVLSVRMLQVLSLNVPHTLLVTIVPDFGLRQTYFRNKQIRFSRLTPIIYDEGQSVGKLIAAETSRTWQYLDSQRNFSGNDTLEVCFVVHAKDREMIAEAIGAYPLFKHRFVDIAEVAQRIKLKPAPTSSHAEELLTFLYAQGSVENHFAEKPALVFSKYRRARIALYAVTAAVLLAGIGVSGYNLFQASSVTSAIDARNQVMRGIQSEYQSISDSLRGQTTATDSVRDASTFYRTQIAPAPTSPSPLLRDLSKAWAEFPNIKLLQVSWATATNETATPALLSAASVTANAIRSDTKVVPGATPAPAPPPPSTQDGDPAFAGNKTEVLMIEAAITNFSGDYRAAIALVERLAKRLGELENAKATIITPPLDTKSLAALQANLNVPESPENRFVIKLVRTRGGA